jgi:Leucine-rich repeat (LRR) protein
VTVSERFEAVRKRHEALAAAGIVRPRAASEEAAAALEQRVGSLPEDYRAWIAEVANGVAGTELLGTEAAAHVLEEGETLEDFAARPFPYGSDDARKMLAVIAKLPPDDLETLDEKRVYGRRKREHGGYLCLGVIGSIYPVLVLNGEERGQVWHLGDTNCPAYARDGSALVACDFLGWYASQLDEIEARAAKASRNLGISGAEQIDPARFASPWIETATLARNTFSEIPDALGALTGLRQLHVTNNAQLLRLPDTIGRLRALVELEVKWNDALEAIPASIGELPQLRKLDLTSNRKLRALPPEIGQLEGLEELRARAAAIEVLPPELGGLRNLRVLDLSYNPIRTIPEELAALECLVELKLAHTGITRLPAGWLRRLKKLKNFSIGSEDADLDVASLGSELAKVRSLSDFETTPHAAGLLADLPRSVRWIRMHGKVGADPPRYALPESLGELARITEIEILRGGVTALPESLGKLSRLKRLYLVDNPIERLPDSIGELAQLGQLCVNGALLRELPDSLAGLRKLWNLSFQENPLPPGTKERLLALLPHLRPGQIAL